MLPQCPIENALPSRLAVFARRLTHSNHFQGTIFGILAFYEGNTAFGVQSFTGIVLCQVNVSGYTITLAVLPTWIRLAQRFHQHLQDTVSLPCYARACREVGTFLRLCPEAVLSISTVSTLMGIRLARYRCLDHTVTRCSRSREGNVEGEKCSLRSTACLMMWSLLRTEVMRDSAVPEIVGCTEDLRTLR